MSKLYFGFLDEAGILEKKADTGENFIISVLIIGDASDLKRVMKIARQQAVGKCQIHRVFKASKEDKSFISIVLQQLAKRNVNIVVGVWSKKSRSVYRDKNILYANLVAATVKIALTDFPRLNLVLHKRYTSVKVRNQIDDIITKLVKSGNSLSINHRTENECRELELADAVAWSVYQKYNNKNQIFYNLIKTKIVKENRLAA